MAKDWSRIEVEAIVADYFEMLRDELLGRPYNKAEHNRNLGRSLNNRSRGAIERKHQNISAVLIELGFVFISGYKPLSSYQGLLFDVVEDRLRREKELRADVFNAVSAEAQIPLVEHLHSCLVAPPNAAAEERSGLLGDRQRKGRKTDYLEMESRNRSLGRAGELFVLEYERARLRNAGADRLSSLVEHVSETKGDGLGFDILSFEEDGSERLIEVKTTAYGIHTPFFVTRNELEVSAEESDKYHLYRTFNFRRSPKLFHVPGALDDAFRLDPTQYRAVIG